MNSLVIEVEELSEGYILRWHGKNCSPYSEKTRAIRDDYLHLEDEVAGVVRDWQKQRGELPHA